MKKGRAAHLPRIKVPAEQSLEGGFADVVGFCLGFGAGGLHTSSGSRSQQNRASWGAWLMH